MSIEPVPDWMRPPGGFLAEDLDHLPELPPHTELIDGSLVLVSPQRVFHALMIKLLDEGLSATKPADLLVRAQMSIVISPRQRLEPDILVIAREAESGVMQTWYPAAAVHLAVEVVSPESEERDRERKPQLYARARIPHFWRVEERDGRAIVYVYELDPALAAYTPTGIYHDRLKVGFPYPIDIDLTAIDRL